MNRVNKTESPDKRTYTISDKTGSPIGRIFYVDDDSFVRSSLARRLSRRGYHVREFESGEAVVTCIKEEREPPDVIILDYKMPGMDGLETYQVIRSFSKDTPVILFTAYSGAINVEEVKRQGILEVLTKHVELENMIEVIQSAIGGNRSSPRD